MERQKFEESLKKTFDQAEFTPSDKVWTNIELDLERLERGQMKRRLTFFKLLAAASIIFALGVAGTGIYLLMADQSDPGVFTAEQAQPSDASSEAVPGDDNQTASANTKVMTEKPDDKLASADTGAASEPANTISESTRDVRSGASEGVVIAPSAQDDGLTDAPGGRQGNIPGLAATGTGENAREDRFMLTFNEQLPPLVKPRKIIPHFPKTEPDQIDLLLASIEMEERAAREKEKFEGEKIWTSVGFSAGTFSNPNPAGAAPATNNLMGSSVKLSSANTTLANESMASGVSYSVGVNVGGKIAPRWVLQGGINYMTQNAAFTSDAVVTQDNQNFKAAYSAEITKLSDASARVVPTAPYSVSNSMEYLSVPLQAGYILVNRAVGIQLNGGISTDLFIQNTLQPKSGSLDKVTNGRGNDSPYRPINFSGLVGTEISYRFAERYRISLNPGIRYPFNSIYKSDVGLSVSPVTFDVGLRFKYIFQ